MIWPGGLATLIRKAFSESLLSIAHRANVSNPHAVSAAQAGADPTGTATAAVSAHFGAATMTHVQLESNFADARLYKAQATIPGGTGAGKAGSLNSTPVEVVASPGAGKMLQVVAIHYWLDYESAAYDTAGNVYPVHTGFGSALSDAVSGSGFNTATSDQHRLGTARTGTVPQEATGISITTTANWYAAAGDSPLKIEVLYRIRTLTW